jgi:hypothetical protein
LTDKLLGENTGISLNNFLEHAWKRHLRVVNWPAGAQFPKHDGVKDLKGVKTEHIRAACDLRRAEMDYAYAEQCGTLKDDATPPTETAYRVEEWGEGTAF